MMSFKKKQMMLTQEYMIWWGYISSVVIVGIVCQHCTYMLTTQTKHNSQIKMTSFIFKCTRYRTLFARITNTTNEKNSKNIDKMIWLHCFLLFVDRYWLHNVYLVTIALSLNSMECCFEIEYIPKTSLSIEW